jgi:PEP-CTERM motif
MKKTLLTLAVVAVSVAAFAQGKVTFANNSDRLFTISNPVAGDTAGPIGVSPLASGNSLIAQLYAGTTAGSMTLQTSYVLDAVNWGPTPGLMVPRGIILTGVPGGAVASFNIIVSDLVAGLGSSFTGVALPGADYFGTTGTFTATPGASISYPGLVGGGPSGSTWGVGNLTISGAAIVPEPSSMVLAGLGAASLLLFRRRK